MGTAIAGVLVACMGVTASDNSIGNIQGEFLGKLEGKVIMVPSSPVQRRGQIGETPLVQAQLEILGLEDGSKRILVTDQRGEFHVSLRPGRYRIQARSPELRFTRDLPVVVDITTEHTHHLQVRVDSGIR